LGEPKAAVLFGPAPGSGKKLRDLGAFAVQHLNSLRTYKILLRKNWKGADEKDIYLPASRFTKRLSGNHLPVRARTCLRLPVAFATQTGASHRQAKDEA